MSNRGRGGAGDREVPQVPEGQTPPHGDVERWLERNLGDQERGPVSHVEAEPGGDPSEAPGTGEAGEDNLVQLPVGARFGMDHEPSAQEREDLVRFAAAADAEMRGQEDRSGRDDEEDSPEGTAGSPRSAQ